MKIKLLRITAAITIPLLVAYVVFLASEVRRLNHRLTAAEAQSLRIASYIAKDQAAIDRKQQAQINDITKNTEKLMPLAYALLPERIAILERARIDEKLITDLRDAQIGINGEIDRHLLRVERQNSRRTEIVPAASP